MVSAKKPMQQPRAQEVSCLCDDQLLERKDSWTHVFRLVSGVGALCVGSGWDLGPRPHGVHSVWRELQLDVECGMTFECF